MTTKEIKISLDYIASMASDIKDILKYDYEISEKLTEIEYCSNIENEAEKIIEALEQQPCEDCISREVVIDTFWKLDIELRPSAIDAILNMVKELPSVTPQQKIGRWIADVDKWGDIVTTVNGYRCSECNTFNTDKDNYCPNCGADMRGEGEE